MAEFKETKPFTPNEWNDGQAAFKYATELKKKYEGDGYTGVKVTYKQLTSSTAKITNPIKDAGPKDACRINSKPRQFYLRFGYLLKYIKENVLPRIKIGDDHNSNPQIFNIDINEWSTYMYSLPNQISLDPRVCIVGNRNFYAGNPNKNTQVYPELPIFREIDNGESDNPNSAYPLNIFLNFEFILECLKPDDRGDVNLFEFISNICTGLNKALGGINNLEPIIDESTNTLSIVDTTPIPGHSDKSTTDYTLQLYGYNKNRDNYISNFVRNVDLKTAITPEFATMITVGATAGGYVKGTEATAFSKWNVGLKDRFKEKFTPGNINSVSPDDNEAETNYVSEFISGGYITRYGFTGLSGNFTLNNDAIERNLSVVTEYYKYLIAKEAADNDTSGGTIGFIPFKLSFTLDGISGFKIYNKLEVNTEFLPKVYGTKSSFIITGVSHNLTGNDWTTQVETTLIPKHGKKSTARIDITSIQESVRDVKIAAFQKAVKTPPSDVIQAMKTYGITDPLEKAHFLAQISHESGQFRYREEIASGVDYEGRKDLGNTQPGDGKRYKGRGYMQLTGRNNYTKYNNYLKSKGITDDVVSSPGLVATKYAADVSAWFWKIYGPSGVKNFPVRSRQGSSVADVTKISKWVNGGTNGLQDRIAKFNYYWSILQKNPTAFT